MHLRARAAKVLRNVTISSQTYACDNASKRFFIFFLTNRKRVGRSYSDGAGLHSPNARDRSSD